ncbi:hypothetical protein GGI24_006056, partial [Coemansia furcata]
PDAGGQPVQGHGLVELAQDVDRYWHWHLCAHLYPSHDLVGSLLPRTQDQEVPRQLYRHL